MNCSLTWVPYYQGEKMTQFIVDHYARTGRKDYPLSDDVLSGFREAVRNNQPSLALEYLSYIVDKLAESKADEGFDITPYADRIGELENELAALKASLAPSRKVTKKVEEDGE